MTPPRPRRRSVPCALAAAALSGALLLGALASPARAHGGVYRGPGATIPPGGATPGSGGPTPTVGGAATGGDSWATWWGFNREPYLDLRAAVRAGGTVSRSSDFYLGSGERAPEDVRLAPPAELLHGRVVPALLAALRDEPTPDLVTAALVALARIGDAPGPPGDAGPLEPVLARYLDHPNQEVAETAALALGILQGDAQAFVLSDLLGDTAAGRERVRGESVPARTRAFAAYGLGLVAHRTDREDVRRFAVQRLVRAFQSDPGTQHDVRVACLLAMACAPLPPRGDDGPPAPDAPAPHPASSLDGQVGFALSVLFDEQQPAVVRAHAPFVLGRLAREAPVSLRARALAALVAPLQRGARYPVEVEHGCAQTLGVLADADSDPPDRAARAALRSAVSTGRLPVRHEALLALARVSSRPGSGAGSTETLRETRAYLLERLSDATTLTRPWVALALGLLERDADRHGSGASPDAVRALRTVLAEARTPDVVGGAAVALALVPDPAAAPLLLEQLEARSEDVARGHVAVALGLVGARSALDPLRDVVRGARHRPGLLRDAATGLGLLGAKDVVPELVAMLRRSESLATQAALAAALGTIGDVRSVEPLLDLLADETVTARARAFAAAALGVVGSKDRLPWSTRYAQDVNYLAPTATLHDPGSGRGVLDLF